MNVIAKIESPSIKRVIGRVKRYCSNKQYGFLVCDEIEADILLHENVLKDFGQSSIATGTYVEALAHQKPNGIQVRKILSLTRALPNQAICSSDLQRLNEQVSDLKPARVKWYDASKGFGFVTVFGDNTEVFVFSRILAEAGMQDLPMGEAISVATKDGERGPVASCIRPWI